MKARLKQAVFALLGKEPEAVIVTFATGRAERVDAMRREMAALVPDRRHIAIDGGDFLHIRERLAPYRVALACVLFDGDPAFDAMRCAAAAIAPTRILAFNARLERHHLRPTLASWLFLQGVAKDHIFDRPWRRTLVPPVVERWRGRDRRAAKPLIAIVTPYLPWPLAHGGAVRMHALLRQAARDFDLALFSFGPGGADLGPLPSWCTEITLAGAPVLRRPRWWGLLPPEVEEFRSPPLFLAVRGARPDLVQVEYTQMASCPGDVLVEHDVTFDLAEQMGDPWNILRWKWFERRAVRRYRRVVVMSEKDRLLLGVPHARVIPNGVDLERFHPTPEHPGKRLLFVANFAHLPNVIAYRFFVDEVWPRLRQRHPDAVATVVGGRDAEFHWQRFTGMPVIPAPEGIHLRGFVADVAPLYRETNLVLVPTLVSAGTNLKALEAMASARAMLSTPSGVAGLGLEPGKDVWVADGGANFAESASLLLDSPGLRSTLAANARCVAEERFGWPSIAKQQAAVWEDLLAQRLIAVSN